FCAPNSAPRITTPTVGACRCWYPSAPKRPDASPNSSYTRSPCPVRAGGWCGAGRLMANVAVIGAQWGDEGKGKIVDWLSARADVVVRFQGGHNAGHTLVIDG